MTPVWVQSSSVSLAYRAKYVKQVKLMNFMEAGPRPLFPACSKIYNKPNSNSKEVNLHFRLQVAELDMNICIDCDVMQ